MRRIAFFIAALVSLLSYSQADPTPGMKFEFDLDVALGEAITVGNVPEGFRMIIPITGGTFEGPEIKGEIVPGGADYQLHTSTQSIIHAIYSIRTDDGVNIFVDNQGVIKGGYFFTTPKLEAPLDSRYAYLNGQVYVCRPVGFGQGSIKLRFWSVCDASSPQ